MKNLYYTLVLGNINSFSKRTLTETVFCKPDAPVTCLSREIDWFVCLDNGHGLVGFDQDFPDFFWVKCGSSYLHLKCLYLFIVD